MWDEGYGSGLMGNDWLATVAGRFLPAWERKDLADGWRAGLRDLEGYRRDMAANVGELVSVGNDEFPW